VVDNEIMKENYKILSSLPEPPSMEPRFRHIYEDTFKVTQLGLPNASLIMQCVLMEALMKEIIYSKEGHDIKGGFGKVIRWCKENEYIDNVDFDFLVRFKDELRNLYIHSDFDEITKDYGILGVEFNLDKNDLVGSILRARDKLKVAPEPLNRYRPVIDMTKVAMDKDRYFAQFLATYRFVYLMAEKHFVKEYQYNNCKTINILSICVAIILWVSLFRW